jgi:histidinol-phosphate aminotransferase
VEEVVQLIRPSVRSEREYVVGAPPEARVKLNQNESPFDLPETLKEDLLEAFTQIEMNRYPAEQPQALRKAIAEHDGVQPEMIIVGNGSNELTYTLGLAFLDPGTPVVLPRPMFSLYEKVAHLSNADLTSVPPNDDLSFDVDGLVHAVQRTEAVLTVLTTPNNPTGLALSMEEIERVVEAAPGMVVVDEAYVEFNPEGTALDLLDRHPNVLVMRTLSKAFGLAGVRLGYLIGHADVVRELMKSRLPFMVDRFSEHVGLTLLDRPGLLRERVAQMQESIAEITTALQSMEGVTVVPSAANFVIFKPSGSADRLQDRLKDDGVLVRNMGGYKSLAGYLRVSAGTPDENKAFLGALERALSEVDAGRD